MGKLFEVLAVEMNAGKAVDENIASATAKFKNKGDLYEGQTRRLTLVDSFANPEEKAFMEAKDSSSKNVQATVADNTNYVAALFANYVDILLQKEEGNTRGKANIVLDNGQVLANDLPVCFLLGMETRLAKFRQLVLEMPTLDPAVTWTDAPDVGGFIVKSLETVANKTTKDLRYDTMAPATDKHPAQVNIVNVEKNVGFYKDIKFSGKVSSSQKAAILTRLDNLIRAVMKARMRANDIEASNVQVGDILMAHLFGDWYDPRKVSASLAQAGQATQASTVKR